MITEPLIPEQERRDFARFHAVHRYPGWVKPLRDAEILRRIHRSRMVTVEELAQDLQVSVSTVRRDLNRLDRAGTLMRVHGGATATSPDRFGQRQPMDRLGVDRPVDEATVRSRADKDAVGAAAADLVVDGDAVLLDVGTTTALLARHLRGRRITVLTSSLAVVDELRDEADTELILLGGVLCRRHHCLAGSLTEDALRQVRVRWTFLGTSGVARDGAILDTTLDQVPIKRAMLKAADRVVVLADRRKLPGEGTLRVCDGDAVDYLITNDGADPAILAACASHGMKVRIA